MNKFAAFREVSPIRPSKESAKEHPKEVSSEDRQKFNVATRPTLYNLMRDVEVMDE